MLNKNSPIPLYYQLKEQLARMIRSGEMPAGSLVPSERELSSRYGISRMTVRQALGELEKEGLLVREQGKGTFVAEPKINQGLWKLTSFSEDMRSRGMVPDSVVRGIDVLEAPPAVANALELSEGERVVRFERVRLADNKPMALEITHLPLARFPGLEAVDLNTQSLYRILEEKYGVSIRRARQTIEVGLSGPAESKVLGIRNQSPVLRIERVTYDASDRPLEFVQSVYRGDRYKLQVELYR